MYRICIITRASSSPSRTNWMGLLQTSVRQSNQYNLDQQTVLDLTIIKLWHLSIILVIPANNFINNIPMNTQDYMVTKHIRKNLFGVRPKTRSFSRVYHSKNYQNMTLEQPTIIRHKSFRKYAPESDNYRTHQSKTIELKNRKIVCENEERKKWQLKNSEKFIKTCAEEQIKQKKIREIAKQGKVSINSPEEAQYFGSFVDSLIDSNYFFQKLEKTLVQSIVLLSIIKKYPKDSKFQMAKHQQKIGFVIFGTAKSYSKDYVYKIQKGDTIGEQGLVSKYKKILKDEETANKYPQNKKLTIKPLQQICLLWITYSNYNILRQEAIREGFRQDFNKLDTHLRMSYLKKKNQKNTASTARKPLNLRHDQQK